MFNFGGDKENEDHELGGEFHLGGGGGEDGDR